MNRLTATFKRVKKHVDQKLWPDPPKRKGISSADLTPIIDAAHHQRLDDLEVFLKRYEIHQLLSVTSSVHSGDTLLHYAAKKGHVGILGLLLDHGADIHLKNNWGSTPLHVAAIEGHAEIAEFLLGRGARPDIGDAGGLSPLSDAARKGHRDTVSLLLDQGACISAQDEHGLTALHHAVAHPVTLKLLLDRGADVDATDRQGLSPLMWLCTAVDIPVYRHSAAILLQHGARTDLRCKKHRTAAELAQNSKNAALVSLIEETEAEREANRVRLQEDITVRRLRYKHRDHHA